MVDNNQRPEDLNPQPIPPKEERKGVSPLIWILLLLALFAIGWWFYQQRGGESIAPPDSTMPTEEPAITSEQEAAATAERERAEANERRRSEQARRAASTPKAPADRDVQPVARVQPEYPRGALRAREGGTVMLQVQVDTAGNPSDVDVIRRSGSRDLDRAAREAVLKWKFQPAIKNGKAVASTVQVPIEFKPDQQ